MTKQVKSMTDEELERELEGLRAKAPERITKPKGSRKKVKGPTASVDAVQEALAAVLQAKENSTHPENVKRTGQRTYKTIAGVEVEFSPKEYKQQDVGYQEFLESRQNLYEEGPEKEWEVWREGFIATGQHGHAEFEGKAVAKSFGAACVQVCGGQEAFDEKKLTVWGCKLFDTQADAIKSFG